MRLLADLDYPEPTLLFFLCSSQDVHGSAQRMRPEVKVPEQVCCSDPTVEEDCVGPHKGMACQAGRVFTAVADHKIVT